MVAAFGFAESFGAGVFVACGFGAGACGFGAGSFAAGGGAFGIGIGLFASRLAFFTDFVADGRTGKRSINTQPTFGTGLPPMRRPASNNHGYC